ncbi:Eco47II family restriction endonuclease [Chroococcidiopsis sp. FACHB-1243]|uniref:Eco47II family restriction endonuclease n=1 Tax=Chroococcidiopsis sp. [FACHB-1243] TaxID=2692781 RepID=UPI0017823B45|nr:Eco47II family restriction endonuclease [Chroococcidiopsis sp. [FACHB-1243]]MBD2304324.1 Eco47II family restriction endonuclease [Chroococcidiopsis sp. [FACHB-1243]]
MSYLPFISDEALKKAVKNVVDCILETEQKQEKEMYKNVIDPFSAVFDGTVQGFSLEVWLKKEKSRQVQKTVQNRIGHFHQEILGGVSGWTNPVQGVDVCNQEKKIIAEIKNKHNTVKGSDKSGIYDYLLFCLSKPEYQEFTAYYVEIIPKNKIRYNRPFTPSDRETGKRKPVNQKIRQIDGQAFYELVTGVPEAISMLFNVLPDVISDVSELKTLDRQQKASFRSLFDRAY